MSCRILQGLSFVLWLEVFIIKKKYNKTVQCSFQVFIKIELHKWLYFEFRFGKSPLYRYYQCVVQINIMLVGPLFHPSTYLYLSFAIFFKTRSMIFNLDLSNHFLRVQSNFKGTSNCRENTTVEHTLQ